MGEGAIESFGSNPSLTSQAVCLVRVRSPPESSDQEQRLLQINERTRKGNDKLRQVKLSSVL